MNQFQELSLASSAKSKAAEERHNIIDNSQVLRIKSAMVLYELERTLGEFVCNQAKEVSDLPSKSVSSIKVRVEKTGRFDDSSPATVVAATYLDEVFGLALGTAKGRGEEKYLLSLRKLFDLLDIFSIRNAISHPNRSFHPSYWYRLAAIATDPLIDKLQFRKVARAFFDAEDGKLASPPEEWMNAPIWSLPNNLPEQFDHAITGLIGRPNEINELNKLMQNQRLNLIAIVAPGGSGKTALILQALQDAILSPQSTEWVDRILYFTSKTEVLTSDGIIAQIPIATNIENLCSSIAHTFTVHEGLDALSFDEVCRQFGEQRILLCLDNLETILRDEPERFERFYQNLPREWRVIVTSRITVNSATTMPLSPLSLGGAKELARNYLSKRSPERLTNEELETLARNCDMNPLAIRLTIDGFVAGKKSLAEMQVHAKQQVIDFSYKNLIEALSPIAHELLEYLFVSSEPVSRTTACALLQRNLDEVSQAFNQIRRTSLVTRTPDQAEECYTLSSSVRDLLVVRPVSLEARAKIQAEIRKTKQLVSEIARFQQNNNPLEREFIPDDAPTPVKITAADALKVWSRSSSTREELFNAVEKVRQAIDFQNHSLLHRVLGVILLRLGDEAGGKHELRQAFEMNPSDVAAGSLLSNVLRKSQDLQEAHSIAKKLVEKGWDKPKLSNPYQAGIVIQNYFLPLIWQGETEKVFEATIDWKKSGAVCGTLGTIRAMAWRQSVDYERNFDTIQEALCSAIDVMDEVFNLEGYAGFSVAEGMKLIEQLVYIRRDNRELKDEVKLKFTTFIDHHLVTLCQEHKSYYLEHPKIREWIQEMSTLSINSEVNPLISERWRSLFTQTTSIEISVFENLDEPWVSVSVDKRPRYYEDNAYKPFLFAQDQYGKKYFIGRDALEFESQLWNSIKPGDRLEIIPEKYPEEGRYPRAVSARFLD